MRMQRFEAFGFALALGISVCLAVESDSHIESSTTVEMASAGVSVPTGVFFNGCDFIKVENSWLRKSITIYSSGRSLYYNGTTYSKK